MGEKAVPLNAVGTPLNCCQFQTHPTHTVRQIGTRSSQIRRTRAAWEDPILGSSGVFDEVQMFAFGGEARVCEKRLVGARTWPFKLP